MKSFLKLCFGTVLVVLALLLVLGALLSISGFGVVFALVALTAAVPGLLINFFKSQKR